MRKFLFLVPFLVTGCAQIIPYDPNKPLFQLVNISQGTGTCMVLSTLDGKPFTRKGRSYAIKSSDCPETIAATGAKLTTHNQIIIRKSSAKVINDYGVATFYRKAPTAYGASWTEFPKKKK